MRHCGWPKGMEQGWERGASSLKVQPGGLRSLSEDSTILVWTKNGSVLEMMQVYDPSAFLSALSKPLIHKEHPTRAGSKSLCLKSNRSC